MVVAELKAIDWYEPGSIKSYAPDPTEPFEFEITLSVGPKGDMGADLFVTKVCNVLELDIASTSHGIFGYGRVIVKSFEYSAFRKMVEDYCASCSGSSWKEVALQVARIGSWEFENYQTRSTV